MLGKLLSSRYRIIKILGSGGFGHTYIAEDTQRPGNPCCVLKHLSFSSSREALLQQARRMFTAEAETLERLGKHDQIPQLLAYFEEDEEFYLVQEFIEGHPLSDELPRGHQWTAEQVITMLEDVLGILAFVHDQGVIHRDIKPDNLIRRDRDRKLVLIDFGAVKNIEQAITQAFDSTTQFSAPVFTSGYGASEQCLGQPRLSSDIYALGMIGIQAVTGIHPAQIPHDAETGELVWRDVAPVEEGLATVLQKMTQYLFTQRYQSATAALQALRSLGSGSPQVTQLPVSQFDAPSSSIPITLPQDQQQARRRPQSPRPWQWGIAGGGIAAAVGSGIWFVRSPVPLPPQVVAPQVMASPEAGVQISRGEKILLPGSANASKQAGVEQVASGQVAQAIPWLEKARQTDRADPETLIYLNNARLGTAKTYTIAVAVPLGQQPKSATEILRGVAQAQTQVNQAGGIQGVGLKVAIANDNDKPTLAQQVATALAKDTTVLGVIGHGTSKTTLAAAAVYQQQKLVVIAPVSSAVQLSDFGRYLFRTMPSDRFSAERLSHYIQTRLKKRKVGIFFNSEDVYSKSLASEFRQALFYSSKGEIVEDIDLSKPDFDATESIEQMIRKKAEVILLAADNSVSDRALLVIQMNQNQLPLLAGDALYTNKTLQVGQKAAVGMVLAVPSIEQSPFQTQAKTLWGRTITWRTLLAYDATQAMITAIRQSPTRPGLQRALADPKFTALGADGPVRFTKSGDRQHSVKLVQVVASRSAKTREFKPIP